MAKYNVFSGDKRDISTKEGVLDPVSLTGVATTSGSHLVTVASITGLHPGMPVRIPGIPFGSFIHAIKDATTLELMCSTFSAAGVWTTNTTNAQATGSATGLLGRAMGFDINCIVSQAYARGPWRNIIRATGANAVGVTPVSGLPYALVPTYSVSGGASTLTAITPYLGDDLNATPTRRHTGEQWGLRPFVHTSGHLSFADAEPGGQVDYAGPDDA